MQHLDALNNLIDAAAKEKGSDYKLAQTLGVPRGHVSAWRYGRRTATPADQALMADIAGRDPVKTLVQATIEQFAGRAKGEQLAKALSKAMRKTRGSIESANARAEAFFAKGKRDEVLKFMQHMIGLANGKMTTS